LVLFITHKNKLERRPLATETCITFPITSGCYQCGENTRFGGTSRSSYLHSICESVHRQVKIITGVEPSEATDLSKTTPFATQIHRGHRKAPIDTPVSNYFPKSSQGTCDLCLFLVHRLT
jgi:hypothetical protein